MADARRWIDLSRIINRVGSERGEALRTGEEGIGVGWCGVEGISGGLQGKESVGRRGRAGWRRLREVE